MTSADQAGGIVEFYRWKDSFCIGVDELDQQHQSFLECLNLCYTQASRGRQARVDADMLKRLAAYAAEHFRCEEEMMRLARYTEMGSQARQHAYFASQIAELEREHTEKGGVSARSVLVLLRDWFLEHVLSNDKKFAVYLAAQQKAFGVRPRAN